MPPSCNRDVANDISLVANTLIDKNDQAIHARRNESRMTLCCLFATDHGQSWGGDASGRPAASSEWPTIFGADGKAT